MKNFIRQFKENYLSIISLFVAVLALIHNNRLYEKSEANRNIRAAAFEMLTHLGELQQEINQLHFEPLTNVSTITGWGQIALIGDLSKLVPQPVPDKVEKLIDSWNDHYKTIKENNESIDAISENIDASRQAIISVIMNLG